MTGQVGAPTRLIDLSWVGPTDVYTEQVSRQGCGWPGCPAGQLDGCRFLADTHEHHHEQQYDDQSQCGRYQEQDGKHQFTAPFLTVRMAMAKVRAPAWACRVT